MAKLCLKHTPTHKQLVRVCFACLFGKHKYTHSNNACSCCFEMKVNFRGALSITT